MSPYIRNDFLAQETMLEILPKFELGRISFLNDKYGPFSPNYPLAVPLWLALFLRETNTCTLRPPREMTVDFLQRALQFEADNDNSFHALPFHFFSLVRQILRYGSADIPDAAVVHRLVDELEQRRISKITKNLHVLQNPNVGLTPAAFSLNLTSSEWLFIKNTLQRVMNDAVSMAARAEQRLHRATNVPTIGSSSISGRTTTEYYQQTAGGGGGGDTSSSSDSQGNKSSGMMMMMGGGGNNSTITTGEYFSSTSMGATNSNFDTTTTDSNNNNSSQQQNGSVSTRSNRRGLRG
jgi:hypothetical protein